MITFSAIDDFGLPVHDSTRIAVNDAATTGTLRALDLITTDEAATAGYVLTHFGAAEPDLFAGRVLLAQALHPVNDAAPAVVLTDGREIPPLRRGAVNAALFELGVLARWCMDHGWRIGWS